MVLVDRVRVLHGARDVFKDADKDKNGVLTEEESILLFKTPTLKLFFQCQS